MHLANLASRYGPAPPPPRAEQEDEEDLVMLAAAPPLSGAWLAPSSPAGRSSPRATNGDDAAAVAAPPDARSALKSEAVALGAPAAVAPDGDDKAASPALPDARAALKSEAAPQGAPAAGTDGVGEYKRRKPRALAPMPACPDTACVACWNQHFGRQPCASHSRGADGRRCLLPPRGNRRRSAEEAGLNLPPLPAVEDDAATLAEVSVGDVAGGELGGASAAPIV